MKQLRQTCLYISVLVLIGCAGPAHSEYPSLKKLFLPAQYSAEAIEGWVVDAETKAPLEGAIVIAIWELERPYNRENPILAGHMQVTEVLTDTQGHYVIPAWGPRERPEEAYMNNHDPLIVVFKEGYDYLKLINRHGSSPNTKDKREEVVHNSVWSGKTVELKKFEGDLESYYDQLRRLTGVLDTLFAQVFGAGVCDWQKIPQMMLAFDKYYQEMSEAGLRPFLIPSIDKILKQGSCGTREEFIRKFER